MEISPRKESKNVGLPNATELGCFDKRTVTVGSGLPTVGFLLAREGEIDGTVALHKKLTADPIASAIEKTVSTDSIERRSGFKALMKVYQNADEIPLNVLNAFLMMVNDVDRVNALVVLQAIREHAEKFSGADEAKAIIEKFTIIFEGVANSNLDLDEINLDLDEKEKEVVWAMIHTLHEYFVIKKKAVKTDTKNIDMHRFFKSLNDLPFGISSYEQDWNVEIQKSFYPDAN